MCRHAHRPLSLFNEKGTFIAMDVIEEMKTI